MTAPTDKNGTAVKAGDTVSFVHFGEHHTAKVDELTEEHGHHHATLPITVTVPLAACTKQPARRSKED